MKSLEIQIRTLTPLWTGGMNRNCDRLHETGLIGLLRWWYEVLVRGLGGHACDPTDENRCPDENGKHCVACELFGCTGWARKFRLQVVDENGRLKQSAIKKNESVTFRFIALRSVSDEEWALLNLTLRLIAEYGAIGGRTVFKPSEEKDRADKPYHQDYGLIRIVEAPEVCKGDEEVRKYVSPENWRRVDHDVYTWASLKNFWCVKGRHLTRKDENHSTFNRVLGRSEPKNQARSQPDDGLSRWLAGGRQESKKVFSFKAGGRRTLGFVKPDLIDFDRMKERLRSAWPGFEDNEFLTGDQILKRLLPGGTGQ